MQIKACLKLFLTERIEIKLKALTAFMICLQLAYRASLVDLQLAIHTSCFTFLCALPITCKLRLGEDYILVLAIGSQTSNNRAGYMVIL